MPEEVRVKITDQLHIYTMAHCSGMIDALHELEGLNEGLRRTPGMALAIATISAEANALRAAVIGKNLAAIARAGHDIGHHKSITYDPNTSELICEFYEPDLFNPQS